MQSCSTSTSWSHAIGEASVSTARVIAVAGLGAPAPSLVTAAFDPPILLQIFVLVTGLSVSSIPRLRFNGDTGTTNYAYNVTDNNLILSVVTLAGLTGVAGAADGILLARANSTGPIGSSLLIGNGPSQGHMIMFSGTAGLMDASAAPALISGSGLWANTARITSIQLDSPAGGNLSAGTGILVVSYEI